ncbi:MAG: diguanylate cyclase [Alphaproteobacteria bacterium]|nr:diguanylate cyclase [Alphaproteobacteria bacterium]
MKILIIDQDELTAQLIRSKLEPLGHQIISETVKNKAVQKFESEQFDITFIDPLPLASARPIILNIRRITNSYPYIVLLSSEATREEAIKSGTNALLPKPLSAEALDQTMEDADRLTQLITRIGDDSEDFPSAGGVISKSAFNQLFLSGIDRADRYGESTFILFISISNYQEILEMDGPYAADYAVAKLSQYLVLLRRQSDIIGQTAKNEYSLLLQRPVYETEPIEAAKRFVESLEKCEEIISSGSSPVEISVCLVDLPVGTALYKSIITPSSE